MDTPNHTNNTSRMRESRKLETKYGNGHANRIRPSKDIFVPVPV